ncbi:MAG TPA: hypothetical protein PLP33_09750 [Leptospiraceae bacterium]|nr:hypothetical protein [Leptospiraceae bacterium]HNC55716.1 hypothetical protein [Leptospiraceae bacterium]HNE07898.1 hypothetical protein [Leptospiraceae bacterium]
MEVIIAIDPESEYLDNTESLLSGAKYNFVKANEFKKGMDYVKTATPDLLMIGIKKIDKELIDTIQFFKKNSNTKNIPILGIYKEQKRSDIENGFKLGINAYLVQPLDKHRLLDKVKELMEISKENQSDQIMTRKNHILIENPTPGLTKITFKSGIYKYVLPQVKKTFNMEFLRTVELNQCCIDIRDIPEMTMDEVSMFEKIVGLFGSKKISIIAGKHLGKIIAGSELSDKANLFMSLEDYVVFLKAAKILS